MKINKVKGRYIIARKQNLKYLLTKELSEMYAEGKGQSKKYYIDITNSVREQMKRDGATYKESLRYNAAENLIFSESTFQNYKKHVAYFCDYVAEQTGNKKMDIEECKKYIQSYVKYLEEEKEWSAFSINLSLSAVVKATHEKLVDYEHPRRELKDIKRSSEHAKNDEINERLCAKELEAARVLGLRRSQLERLRVEDIREITVGDKTFMEASIKGKGGKMNVQTYYSLEDIEAVRNLIKDKKSHEYVLDKKNFRDCDFHSCRADHAKSMYEYVLNDINTRENAREEWLAEIQRLYERDGKHFQREKFEGKFFARGEHKKFLEEKGFETSLEKIPLAITSLSALSHYRLNVTAENYIWK